MSKKLGIIVPYRDRYEQLLQFKKHINEYLSDKDIDYELIIVEQDDAQLFNRGKLLNVGFKYAKRLKCDYVVFHDIDMLPVDVDYSYSDIPVHMATDFIPADTRIVFDEYFGGVTMFTTDDFTRINGYSNEYWGWGAEDDDVLLRCSIMGIGTFRKDCKYRSLSHERKIDSVPYWTNVNRLRSFQSNPTSEAISRDGISTLKYKKTGETRISDSSRKITFLL